jgi:hypothetical protein
MKDRVAVPIVMVRDTKELSGYAYVNAVIGLRKVKLLLDTGAADSWVSETRFFRDRYLRSIAEDGTGA